MLVVTQDGARSVGALFDVANGDPFASMLMDESSSMTSPNNCISKTIRAVDNGTFFPIY